MRPPKPTETVKRNKVGINYFDELGRNVFYHNYRTKVSYEKEWAQLPDGRNVETFVQTSLGYWRRHNYDPFTGKLVNEIDSSGNRDLLEKRQNWNKNDRERSPEVKQKKRAYVKSSKGEQLF